MPEGRGSDVNQAGLNLQYNEVVSIFQCRLFLSLICL